MQPINILLFFWAAIVLVPVFLFLPYISKYKEPFSYKTKEPLDVEQFLIIRNKYYKKIILFSIPFSAVIIIIYLFIQSTSFSTLLLGIMLMGLVCGNLIFYMQAYSEVKAFFLSKKEAAKLAEATDGDKPNVESW